MEFFPDAVISQSIAEVYARNLVKPVGKVDAEEFGRRRVAIAVASAIMLVVKVGLDPSNFFDITNLHLTLTTFVFSTLARLHYDKRADFTSRWPLIHLTYEIVLQLTVFTALQFWLLEAPLLAWDGRLTIG